MIFFGVPHKGMIVDHLIQALEKSGNENRIHLLNEVKEAAITLTPHLERFVEICYTRNIFLYSYYEDDAEANAVLVSFTTPTGVISLIHRFLAT